MKRVDPNDLKGNPAALKRAMFLIKLMSNISIATLWVILLRVFDVI